MAMRAAKLAVNAPQMTQLTTTMRLRSSGEGEPVWTINIGIDVAARKNSSGSTHVSIQRNMAARAARFDPPRRATR
jgi:hypothetical protein